MYSLSFSIEVFWVKRTIIKKPTHTCLATLDLGERENNGRVLWLVKVYKIEVHCAQGKLCVVGNYFILSPLEKSRPKINNNSTCMTFSLEKDAFFVTVHLSKMQHPLLLRFRLLFLC
jgi:hypothetical protein